MSADRLTNPVDTSQEAVDVLTERLWEYGTVIGKPLSSQDAVCHCAADMIEALRLQLTANEKLAKTLAVLGLQSARYSTDGEFQQAVDDVLHATREVRL